MEVPPVTTPTDKMEELHALRNIPLCGERQVVWALQSGDDVESRVALPDWVSQPVSRKVAVWADQNQSWEEKIQQRLARGLSLTKSQQATYDNWVATQTEQILVFSKKSQAMVHKLKATEDMAKLRSDLISITVTMSQEPDELRVQTGDGTSMRLVVLRGQPIQQKEMPACIDHEISTDVLNKAVKVHNEGEEFDEEVRDDPDLQEQEAQEAAENAIEGGEKEESDGEAIMYFTDEEDLLKPVGKHHRVKDFYTRKEWQDLEKLEATMLPPGTHLGYHKTTRCWQGYYQGASVGLTFSHGGQTHRTASEALFAVILGLVKRHTEDHPRDALWKSQLQKLKKIEATVAKLWLSMLSMSTN